jgi:hypothetical protein
MKSWWLAAIGIVSVTVAVTAASAADGEEQPWGFSTHNHGLRWAEWGGEENPKLVRLIFGASFVEKNVGPEFEGTFKHSYIVASAADEDFKKGSNAFSTFEVGVPAIAAKVVGKEEEGRYPPGWAGPKFHRYRVEIELAQPLKKNHRYWVRIANGYLTKGQAAAWIAMSGEKPAHEQMADRLGLRRLELVAPTILQATLGPGVSLENLEKADAYRLSCPEDDNYKAGRAPVKIGRRSRMDCYYPDGWPWKFFQKHEVFLVFDKPFAQGRTYELLLNAKDGQPTTCGDAKGTLLVDDKTRVNPIIKVNQLGYLSDVAARYAYVGAWMGSLGTLDLAEFARKFEVRDAKTHAVVLSGEPKLRLKHVYQQQPDGSLAPDPKTVKGKETVYNVDLSFEDVYEMDLGPLTKNGLYYLAIPGMGRSFSFQIGPNVYDEGFRVCMNGALHERCGIEMKEPYSPHYRLPCHIGNTELTTYLNTGFDGDAWKNLEKHTAADKNKYKFVGGHHDAGDFNPRSHLDVAETAFLAYEITPDHYFDGQLNVPERGNGIPDILDEGRWALNLWVQLQDTDGGVRNGIEAAGDDYMAREFAFAKDARGSCLFAAAAAQAALLWDQCGKKDDAAQLLDRAKKAWDWALKNRNPKEPEQQVKDATVAAAIQLYRATGEKIYLDAFHGNSVFAGEGAAELSVYQKHDQENASFYYALCAKPVDEKIKGRIVDAFKRRMGEWMRWADTCGYRYMRSPYAPNSWGTGGLPHWLLTPMMAWKLTGNVDYRKWVALTCDFSLGCHPMNLVFTVKLGKRYITGPLHSYGSWSPDGPIAGTQCEGPYSKIQAGFIPPSNEGCGRWPGMAMYPKGTWPELHTYAEYVSPGMNEGGVSLHMRTAAAYGFLLPDASVNRK